MFRRIPIGIHSDHDDLHLIRLLAELPHSLREFSPRPASSGTRRAVGVAEVQHHQLAPKIGQADRLAARPSVKSFSRLRRTRSVP